MVKRTKRSMDASKAAAMQPVLKSFHHEVRRWCAETPIKTTVYVALDNLNSALLLMDAQLNAAIDDRYERSFGQNGIE
ncbi:hypothetical protein LJR009_003044 [Bosea sp. LjRoot9]|uniref:hypothetical protein n=1 Tax=Bosea sp. LjRoot9 TaxID=3342341 RepID=UPI003ECCDD7C